MDNSDKYEPWGPLYIQETGEEQDFTQDPRKIPGEARFRRPCLMAPQPSVVKAERFQNLAGSRCPGLTSLIRLNM